MSLCNASVSRARGLLRLMGASQTEILFAFMKTSQPKTSGVGGSVRCTQSPNVRFRTEFAVPSSLGVLRG
jgi:hypothetical protein